LIPKHFDLILKEALENIIEALTAAQVLRVGETSFHEAGFGALFPVSNRVEVFVVKEDVSGV
jgi:hypothetical protein